MGRWDDGACFPAGYNGGEPGQPWTPTMHTLQTLQLLGLNPTSESAKNAIALVAENCRWEQDGQRYFDGEVEPCINGRTIETGAYFGVDVTAVVDRIVSEILGDGACSVGKARARSSTPAIWNSRFRTTGTTTCCEPSTTSAAPVETLTPV